MSRRIISALLVFLLLASVSIPTVTAEPAPFVTAGAAAAPEIAEVVISGITVVMSGIAALKIAENLGMTWDNTMKGWDQLMKDTSSALDNLFHSKQWIKVTSQEGKAIMAAVYELNAGGSSGGKKDDKWYFEARIHNRQIEINPELMSEEQAVKEMDRGKHIMTVRQSHAEELINRFNNDPPKTRVLFEKHPRGKYGKEEFFKHANFEAKNQRCHVWVWEP